MGKGGKGWLPVIFIPVNRFRTSGVQQQTIRAGDAVVLLDLRAPPVLEYGFVGYGICEGGVGIGIAESPANL